MYRLLAFITLLVLPILNYTKQETVYIDAGEVEVLKAVTEDLVGYLSITYPNYRFFLDDGRQSEAARIVFEINSEFDLEHREAYSVSGNGGSIIIRGKTPRAIINGVYGLLKHIGWNFYLSFDVPPADPRPLFSDMNIGDSPLKDRRIIFNWHNFISGCTGWDFEQWQEWIGNSSKIGFNTIMVHAYGNNPMQSFSMNGHEKEIGFLTTTKEGRDWGAQHVNDVRLLHGGEIFEEFEFGSEAAKVQNSGRVNAATSLMKKVFKHAARRAMDVCFAIDVDTWMSNPQNIIQTLPAECLLEVAGYKVVNPEHPGGRRYYEALLEKLLSDYPEISILAAWMRHPTKNPGIGSIWLQFDSKELPGTWQNEFRQKLNGNPELVDERPYPGLFAISKIVRTLREILDEIRPDIELVLGSWRLDYPTQADPLMPESCGFIPLDWEYVFDQPEVLEKLSEVGRNRKLYPIIWAHHDDHRYIGRPYKPFKNFNSLLNQTNSHGYGIIHWTTHPLDLVFNNYESQVWKRTENQTLEGSAVSFANSLLKREDPKLVEYYRHWFSEGPMFGRETTDFFIFPHLDYELEGYSSSLEVIEKATKRLSILEQVNVDSLKSEGLREFRYQLGMENFILSFFENHHNLHQAFMLLKENEPEDARSFIEKTDPSKTIDIYKETINRFGATRGEEGILISLNLRWLPDYIDTRQRVGLEPIRINFQATSHDPLAQGAGKNTFFVDENRNFWIGLGEKETGLPTRSQGDPPILEVTDAWIEISEATVIPLKTMRGYDIPAGAFELSLNPAAGSGGFDAEVLEGNRILSAIEIDDFSEQRTVSVEIAQKSLALKITPSSKEQVKLAGIQVTPR